MFALSGVFGGFGLCTATESVQGSGYKKGGTVASCSHSSRNLVSTSTTSIFSHPIRVGERPYKPEPSKDTTGVGYRGRTVIPRSIPTDNYGADADDHEARVVDLPRSRETTEARHKPELWV